MFEFPNWILCLLGLIGILGLLTNIASLIMVCRKFNIHIAMYFTLVMDAGTNILLFSSLTIMTLIFTFGPPSVYGPLGCASLFATVFIPSFLGPLCVAFLSTLRYRNIRYIANSTNNAIEMAVMITFFFVMLAYVVGYLVLCYQFDMPTVEFVDICLNGTEGRKNTTLVICCIVLPPVAIGVIAPIMDMASYLYVRNHLNISVALTNQGNFNCPLFYTYLYSRYICIFTYIFHLVLGNETLLAMPLRVTLLSAGFTLPYLVLIIFVVDNINFWVELNPIVMKPMLVTVVLALIHAVRAPVMLRFGIKENSANSLINALERRQKNQEWEREHARKAREERQNARQEIAF